MPTPSFLRRQTLRGCALAAILATSQTAWSEPMTTLFKVVTVKDDIVIGLDQTELTAIGGSDAGAVAKALISKGELSVWQYAVKRGPNAELVQGPHAKIGLLAHSSLRVEPYSTPYQIVPHE